MIMYPIESITQAVMKNMGLSQVVLLLWMVESFRWMEIGMILMKKLLNLRNGMTQKRELNTGFW